MKLKELGVLPGVERPVPIDTGYRIRKSCLLAMGNIEITEALHKKGWVEVKKIKDRIDAMIKANGEAMQDLDERFSYIAEPDKVLFTGENMGLQRAKVLIELLMGVKE